MRIMSEGQLETGLQEEKSLEHSMKASGFILKMTAAMVIAKLIFSSKPPASSSSLNVNLHIPAGRGNNLGDYTNQ